MSNRPFDRADWVIVGGGLVGQLAALSLVQRDLKVGHIYTPPDHDPRTSGIMASSIDFLEQINVWGALEKDAYPLTHISLFDGTDHIVRAPEVHFAAKEIGLNAFGYNVPNDLINLSLRQKLSAFENYIHLDALADGYIKNADDAWVVSCAAGSITAPNIAAADGRHSKTRHAAAIAHQFTALPQSALVTSVKVGRDHQHCSSEFHFEHGPLTLVPAQTGLCNIVWVDAHEHVAHLKACDEHSFTDILFEKTNGLLGPYTLASKRHSFKLEALQCDMMARNGVFLLGEAGHVLPPLGAQGLNLGIRDIQDLLKVAANSSSDQTALYNERRAKDLKQTHFGTMSLNQLMLDAHLGADIIKASGLQLLKNNAAWRNWLARKGVGYT